jgi:DNA (cytosine-5)-methyltransferase 1
MSLIIDLFAGGGGASCGIEMALGRAPDVAINHNPRAIAFHQMNHPDTLHLVNDVWDVDPLSVRPGEKIGILWASPDCKHFSKAKGGAPLDRNIRDLAWVIVDWAEKRHPETIFVENVEEFVTWCLIGNDGQPVWELKGQIFNEWKRRLRAAGYRVEARKSRASSYGAPTIRQRLCVIAKLNGKPVWPKPQFGDPKTRHLHRLPKWRTAADHVIDWSLPCPSMFDTKQEIKARYGVNSVRPLAPATLSRIARGIKRYVLDAKEPFLVSVAHGYSGGRREYGLDEPLGTVTGSPEKALVTPTLVTMGYGERPGQEPRANDIDAPLNTVTAGGVKAAVIAPSLIACHGAQTGSSVDQPAPTVTGNSFIKRRGGAAPIGVLAPVLTYAQHGGASRSADEPSHTITASGKDQNHILVPHLMTMRNAAKPFSAADEPCHTVTAGGAGLVEVAAFLAQHNTGVVGRDAREPLSTVTQTGSQQNVVAPVLLRQFGQGEAHDAREPLRTVMPGGQGKTQLAAPFVVKYYGTGDGQEIGDPLHTVTVKDRHGLVQAETICPPMSAAQEARARQVAQFLRSQGAWEGGELVTLTVRGVLYVMVDIGIRMLTPRELFNAQGFPPDLKLEAEGLKFTKSELVGFAGNSCSPCWVAAHIAANCSHMAAFREAAE